MNVRHEYALSHPVNDPRNADVTAYRTIEITPSGDMLVVVLAVDR